MPKAKLSQIATTWVDEDPATKKKDPAREKSDKKMIKTPEIQVQVKKKQTFNLKAGTLDRLWGHRVKTGTTISKTIDDLVSAHLPVIKLEEIREK